MLFESARDVFNKIDSPYILAFSGGKDSIVMLDIAMKIKPPKEVVHFYFCPCLPSREKLLTFYENKYKIKIHKRESWYGMEYRTGKKVKQKQVFDSAREEFDIKYIAEGIKPTDSIIRNAMIKKAEKGINKSSGQIFPLYRWFDSACFAYIRQNRLMLPPEYTSGHKNDISNPTKETIDWLRKNLPKDYDTIIRYYPGLKNECK